jgi:hypothetical protein
MKISTLEGETCKFSRNREHKLHSDTVSRHRRTETSLSCLFKIGPLTQFLSFWHTLLVHVQNIIFSSYEIIPVFNIMLRLILVSAVAFWNIKRSIFCGFIAFPAIYFLN